MLPPDAPDPRIEAEARARTAPFPVMGLMPQPSLEDRSMVGIAEGHDSTGRSQLSVSIGYTLWRNPDDPGDPVNLADLDDRTRAAIEDEPPWPRPAWLIEQVQRMRYPQLWEAVRTTWHREPAEHTTVSRQLVEHANHILMNQFREQLGLEDGPTTRTEWMISETSVNPAATLQVEGTARAASEIDTDPFVYAIGVQLDPDVVATIVVPRDELPHVELALVTRTPRTT